MDAKIEPASAKRPPYHEESELHRAHEHQSASAVLRAVIDEAKGETISIREIIEAFGERAFGFVLILFSLPNCVPAPPGIAGIVGTPVLIFGIQMMLGHTRPWLPGFILRRSVSTAKFKRLIDIAEPKLQKLESYCKPRLLPLFGPFGDRVAGFFAFLVAVSVLIPFPGTNFPPSIALVIASIAIMEEDGYLLIVGYLIGLAGLAYTATVLGASYHLILATIHNLPSWLGF
ncbi:exopolysaccharide biosynthesis protein [Microvirga lotononidis]|uniref:Putative ABC-type transport system, permease component n=1 Tax=Microvirga lotononidis TaxID=864069 RepID=I4YTU0_9HYPH|nr:exopolysaccharide biosynthesis protein [Microvirga lotononidis]EIM27382.1 putative ABC-type transport system, permease component [Microvirga lotononidis]WQO28449.1 exopolysaccharide biosynthesis protein [Microvirga lotononidis]